MPASYYSSFRPRTSGMMNRIMVGLSKENRTESDPTNDHSPTPASSSISDGDGGEPSSPESRDPSQDEQDENDTSKAKANGSGNGCSHSKEKVVKSQESTTSEYNTDDAPLRILDPPSHPRALKVLFLSSDTGGGHRASATSLAQQFQNLFPGSSYALCDIVQLDGPPPYNMLVRSYKHLSAHPQQWKLVYNVSNTRAYEMLADVHMKSAMERSVRKRIRSYDPDVVVSVHPLMTNVPVLACKNIAKDTGRHLPIFTVCTDLGSAHSMWFANGVEKLFVASDAIKDLAMQRGKVPLEKIVMSGLPIRHDFALQATKMGERHSPEGKVYQRFVREQLGLGEYGDRKTVLVMGGGEGCGRLSNIVDALYLQFVERGMEALILVVCGRNEALRESLAKRDWEGMKDKYVLARTSGADFDSCVGLLSDVGCFDGTAGGMAGHLRRIISTPSMGLSKPENAFSPAKAAGGEGGGAIYRDDNGAAVSLPGSRTASPGPMEGDDNENVEVVTKSCAERNNLYDLNSLMHPLESTDDYADADEEGRGVLNASGAQVVSTQSSISEMKPNNSLVESPVAVVGLGFISRVAEYMVASDVLISKAGPGTIAEAASLSLPVMLTSFLPGQEEGNVDYVIQGNFGTFVSDNDPQGISDVVAGWLLDDNKLRELSDNAQKRGAPDAAAEIVEAIGESALKWKKIDEDHHTQEIEGGFTAVNA